MARVPYPEPDDLDPETVAFLERLPALNIFRMMAGGEGLLRAFTRFGNHLLHRTALDPVLREIAIVRVGVLTGASYELYQHEEISRRLGMSDELLAAVHAGPGEPSLDEVQRLVVAYTDDLVANVRAADATFEPLRARLTMQELQELTITIGFYLAVARYLETFGVDIEDSGQTTGLQVD
ncbi:MAG: carboxymuconolactone decarboxylase family protein [Ilumatobacteraceae bacterium]